MPKHWLGEALTFVVWLACGVLLGLSHAEETEAPTLSLTIRSTAYQLRVGDPIPIECALTNRRFTVHTYILVEEFLW